MTETRGLSCLSSLLDLAASGRPQSAAEMRRAVDAVLDCDREIRCSERLHCTWLAAELANRLWLSVR